MHKQDDHTTHHWNNTNLQQNNKIKINNTNIKQDNTQVDMNTKQSIEVLAQLEHVVLQTMPPIFIINKESRIETLLDKVTH